MTTTGAVQPIKSREYTEYSGTGSCFSNRKTVLLREHLKRHPDVTRFSGEESKNSEYKSTSRIKCLLLSILLRIKTGLEGLIDALSYSDGTQRIKLLLDVGFFKVCQIIDAVSKKRWTYIQLNGKGAVAVIPVTEDGKVLLIQQKRPVVNAGKKKDCCVIEFPGGLRGDIKGEEDETPEKAAHRELLEETGYEADKFTFIKRIKSAPGLSNLDCDIFIAEKLKKVSDKLGTEGEGILELYQIPIDNVVQWLNTKEKEEGCAASNSVYSGLFFLHSYRDRLLCNNKNKNKR